MLSWRRLRMIWTSLRMLARCRSQSPNEKKQPSQNGLINTAQAARRGTSDGPRSRAASSSSRDQDASEVRNDENRERGRRDEAEEKRGNRESASVRSEDVANGPARWHDGQLGAIGRSQ